MSRANESTEALLKILQRAHGLNQTLTQIARRSTGLRFEQVSLLCALNDVGGASTIGGLARAISRASHTVTALTDRLEVQGYLLRDPMRHDDRREVWVRLTKSGAFAVDAFQADVQHIIAERGLQPIFPPLLASLQATTAAFAYGVRPLSPTAPRSAVPRSLASAARIRSA